MHSLEQPDSQLSLLDSAMTENPLAFAESSLESDLRNSGSTWKMIPKGPTMKGLTYANLDGQVYVSTRRIARAEIYLANKVRSMNCEDRFVRLVSSGLTESQVKVAGLCLAYRISCLSGLPGTGKTYTCRAIAESLLKDGYAVKGCAPTGIAASRLQESSQIECTTIHRMLGWRGYREGFTVDTVYADAIILDESSMLDNQLLLSLLSRLTKDCKVILVGDPDQLSSVEPSDTFRQLCNSLPHGRLTEILRTEKDSPIGNAALRLLSGNVPVNESIDDGGVYVVQCDSLTIDINGKRSKNHPLTIAERMSALDESELREVRTMACTNVANSLINHQFTNKRKLGKPYRLPNVYSSDRHPVMCTKNMHDIGIYNGELGIRKSDWEQYFNGKLYHVPRQFIVDAWSTTVHKAQGKESKSAQMWIEPSLTKRMAYTALTRAKNRFCFVGDIDTLTRRIQVDDEPRVTLLSALIDGSATYIDTTEE